MNNTKSTNYYKFLFIIIITLPLVLANGLIGKAANPVTPQFIALSNSTSTASQTSTPIIPKPGIVLSPTPTPIPSLPPGEWWVEFLKELINPVNWTQSIWGVALTVILVLLYRLISYVSKLREFFNWWLKLFSLEKIESQEGRFSYTEKIQELSSELRTSFEKIDKLLGETQSLMDSRKNSLNSLETNVEQLENREIELKKRVETLEKIPIQALDYFIKVTEASEKKAAQRDYSLFFAGLIGGTLLSTVVSIVLRALGWF